jgi:hypothetical protein
VDIDADGVVGGQMTTLTDLEYRLAFTLWTAGQNMINIDRETGGDRYLVKRTTRASD